MKKTLISWLALASLIACERTLPVDPEAEKLLSQLESTGDLIVAKKMSGEIPLDPDAAHWKEVREFVIPLISQTSVVPRATAFHKTALSVRALYSRKGLGLLLSWSDPTKDEREGASELFRDAVAVGFPMNYGEETPLPYIGMGNTGRPVNIWHWKASFESGGSLPHPPSADAGPIPPNPSAPDRPSRILRGELFESDTYPIDHRTGEEAGNPLSARERKGPVENLLAEGFGTLTSVKDEAVTGKGVWRDGKWRVVIKRKLSSKTGVSIDRRKGVLPFTVAVWDGSGAERNGIKGLARWRFLRWEGEGVSRTSLKSLIIGPIPGADAAHGKELIKEMGCISCHNLPERLATNDVGPDLVHAGTIHRPEYLLEAIKDPNAVIVPAPGYFDPQALVSKMPSFEGQVPEKDYADIAEYLRGLQ